MSERPLKFKAHFNRVNMQRGNPNVWTVHTSRACYQGARILIRVPVDTVYKPEATQPRAYFSGRGVVRTYPSIHGGTTILVSAS